MLVRSSFFPLKKSKVRIIVYIFRIFLNIQIANIVINKWKDMKYFLSKKVGS